MEITAGGVESELLHHAVDRAFDAVALVHELMSFHDEASDVSRLNEGAWQHPVRVHPQTYEVLSAATMISSQTEGLFDCTIAPHLVRWDYLPRRGPAVDGVGARWSDVQLLPDQAVAFSRPLQVDLGGIAKGFAVDRAVAVLKENGVSYGCVNAGGDLRVFGVEPQPLALRSPQNPRKLIPVGALYNTAVATSSPHVSWKWVHRRRVSPYIDPDSRCPFVSNQSISVFAPSCMVADALTKPVMFSRSSPASFLRRFHASTILLAADHAPRLLDS